MSPSDPPGRISAARMRAYASTTHCASITVAPKSACNAGNARLTTLLSMKARLDPRIVAARTHRLTALEQGAENGDERRTPSSHGWPTVGFHFATLEFMCKRIKFGSGKIFFHAAFRRFVSGVARGNVKKNELPLPNS